MKILHMARGRSQVNPVGPLAGALREIGELVIIEKSKEIDDDEILEEMRRADVVITNWASQPIPSEIAADPGRLRYVLNLGGTCRATVPIEIIRSDIQVTNWGDTPAFSIGEGAMSLLLSVLKDLRGRTDAIEAGKGCGAKQLGLPSGTLYSLHVGLYGCGAIGRRFVNLIKPFDPKLWVYDPYAEKIPEACERVDSLEELFDKSEAVVILAGLNDSTRLSVTAELLAKLPDHGIVINVARAEIVDEDALFAELKSKRLRAGLDVYGSNDHLPPDHEARKWPNLLLTAHDINSAHWPARPNQLSYSDNVALNNVKHFVAGEPLEFVMDEKRFLLSS